MNDTLNPSSTYIGWEINLQLKHQLKKDGDSF